MKDVSLMARSSSVRKPPQKVIRGDGDGSEKMGDQVEKK